MRANILIGKLKHAVNITNLTSPMPIRAEPIVYDVKVDTYDDVFKLYHYAIYPHYINDVPAVYAIENPEALCEKLRTISDPPPVNCPLTVEKAIRHLSRFRQVTDVSEIRFPPKRKAIELKAAGLDPEQSKAAEHYLGPLLCVAPAGSGKTSTLITRVTLLVQRGVDPRRILCLTFTKKAQLEMQERLKAKLGDKAKQITVRTYHALAYMLMKEFTGHIPDIILDRFSILKNMELSCKLEDLDGFISLNLNSLVSPQEIKPSTRKEKQLLEGYRQYLNYLKENRLTDQDFLLVQLCNAFRGPKGIQLMDYTYPGDTPGYPKGRWHFVFIDEAQDNNLAQDVITRFISPWDNTFWVGDEDQCLLPDTLIATKQGAVAIKDIKNDNELIVANGHGTTITVHPEKVMSRYYSGPIVKVITSSGKQLTGTPEHCVFARMTPEKNRYLVYLMYSKKLGYRIGRTSTVRSNYKGSVKGLVNGHEVRLRQEKGNTLWILEVCDKLEEACFYEQYYSVKYGLPTCVFHTNGRDMSITQKLVDKLFGLIDTRKRAHKLMQDKLLNPEEPHHFPKARTTDNRGARKLHFTMFGSSKMVHGGSRWSKGLFELHNHELTYNTVDEEFAKLGMNYMGNSIKSTPGGTTYWNGRTSNGNYDSLWQTMQKMQEEILNLSLEIKAKLTGEKYKFMPLSHVRKGMLVPVLDGDIIAEEEVTSVEFNQYNGLVYDINVPYYRNYVAGGFVVHNCLYTFRGSSIERILNLRGIYPNLKEIQLKRNYRCHPGVVAAADSLIRHNTMRRPKEIIAARQEKGRAVFFENFPSITEEYEWVAEKIDGLLQAGVKPEHIAVLYRNNSQGDALSSVSLKKANIPHYVHRNGTPLFQTADMDAVLNHLTLLTNKIGSPGYENVVLGCLRTAQKSEYIGALESGGVKAAYTTAKTNNDLKAMRIFLNAGSVRMDMLPDAGAAIAYARRKFPDLDLCFDVDRLDLIEKIAGRFKNIKDFTEWVRKIKLTGEKENKTEGKVQLMTVHSSKGLEFPVVFLINCTTGHFPSKKAATLEEIEEERRVFYVGMTRARERLYISGYEEKERRISGFVSESGCLAEKTTGVQDPGLLID
ncbi:MAG: putative ATP-dependent DNA helicase YjcD [Pelotomaculum sp. PtaB.Bin104]|nr:MAG: putative ATP-dependent DNA helicase YjcD [Pelotomaculum sp. PtaB.Bin104]